MLRILLFFGLVMQGHSQECLVAQQLLSTPWRTLSAPTSLRPATSRSRIPAVIDLPSLLRPGAGFRLSLIFPPCYVLEPESGCHWSTVLATSWSRIPAVIDLPSLLRPGAGFRLSLIYPPCYVQEPDSGFHWSTLFAMSRSRIPAVIYKLYSFLLRPGAGFRLALTTSFLPATSRAGIFKKSMGARNRGGIGLSYRPARLHRLAEFIPWNQFRGPINI